jgi:hypothetical protein
VILIPLTGLFGSFFMFFALSLQLGGFPLVENPDVVSSFWFYWIHLAQFSSTSLTYVLGILVLAGAGIIIQEKVVKKFKILNPRKINEPDVRVTVSELDKPLIISPFTQSFRTSSSEGQL